MVSPIDNQEVILVEGKKEELGLGGDANWPHIAFVRVPGTKGDITAKDRWHTVAVLRVEPSDQPFRIGFKNGTNSQLLKPSVETAGLFGMRVGEGDVEFYVIPDNRAVEILLELIAVTTDDDPDFAKLPLY